MLSMTPRDDKRQFRRRYLLHGMIAIFGILWIVCAISPWHRFDWLLENLLVFIAVPLLVREFATRPLSDISYICIFIFLCLHTIGAHYTYAEVPVGTWMQTFLNHDRNHYDRVVHFTFGLLGTYPIRETLIQYVRVSSTLNGFIAFTIIATSSTIFEIIEMFAAMIVSPDTAIAYLGVQGDVFDAQKDSALAIAGCIIALVFSMQKFRMA